MKKNTFKTAKGELVSISSELFLELIRLDKELEKSDRKYYRWNVSYDADIIVSPKYAFGTSNDFDFKESLKRASLEEIIISREKIENINKILEKENDRNKKIIMMGIQGFSEMEIAKEIGISQPMINRIKRRFSKDIERLKQFNYD